MMISSKILEVKQYFQDLKDVFKLMHQGFYTWNCQGSDMIFKNGCRRTLDDYDENGEL